MTSGANGHRPLVFVTVGGDHHPFDRLMQWLSRWLAEVGPDRVECIVQHGPSAPPPGTTAVPLLDHDELLATMHRAHVVVSSGGPSTLMEARQNGHIPIVVPRRATLGEHVDDHQLAFAQRLHDNGRAIRVLEEDEFVAALERALAGPRSVTPVAGAVPEAAVLRVGELIEEVTKARTRQSEAELVPSAPAPANDDVATLPTVSVVVPTRDRPELLRRSVAAILGQDYAGPVECIVVFDQSEPRPIAVASPPGRTLRTITNTRTPGLAGARNSGILAASGELVAFCDDDDEWLPSKLTAQVAVLRAHPATQVVGCDIVLVEGRREIDKPVPRHTITFEHLLLSRVWELHPGTVLARRAAILAEIGLIDEEIPGSYAEDYDWLLRAAKVSPIRIAPQTLVRITWHPGSFFAQRWQVIIDALTYLLAKYPEFQNAPAGLSRIEGQIAFAHSALGNRSQARKWAVRTLRTNWREKRAYVALAVCLRLVNVKSVLRLAHARGHGI